MLTAQEARLKTEANIRYLDLMPVFDKIEEAIKLGHYMINISTFSVEGDNIYESILHNVKKLEELGYKLEQIPGDYPRWIVSWR